MRFLVDAMLPPQVAERLNAAGHDAVTPAQLGADNLPDEVLIQVPDPGIWPHWLDAELR